ncbi:hypothetical protein R1sor_017370 [Riccia sorocarpa]|uniref:Uncharacterized protein n=1 Tax=Riccia sorocarpa TaxID=122646 RepID=A0ABD3I6M6_9MARC
MTSEGQSKFLGILHISKCWGPSGGQLTYAGCGRLLKDGRPCGLGLKARRLREISSSTQMSSSQHGTPGGRSRDRGGHTCVEIGEHVQMYHFFVETVKSCHILKVWDRAGEELFNMPAQEIVVWPVRWTGMGIELLYKNICNSFKATAENLPKSNSWKEYMTDVFDSYVNPDNDPDVRPLVAGLDAEDFSVEKIPGAAVALTPDDDGPDYRDFIGANASD